MPTRFYIDPATGLPHIHNHQVDQDEAIEVLEKPSEDRPGRAGARAALGETAAGRYLQIMNVPHEFVPKVRELIAKRQS